MHGIYIIMCWRFGSVCLSHCCYVQCDAVKKALIFFLHSTIEEKFYFCRHSVLVREFQERYVESARNKVNRVLDIGCGTGMAQSFM